METQWIPAAQAAKAIGAFSNASAARLAICRRAEAGLLRSFAHRTVANGVERDNEELPKIFWWAKGQGALEQDWDLGDFSTWIEGNAFAAYGVAFDLDGLRKMLLPEQAALLTRRLSVADNPEWLTALEARAFVYNKLGQNPMVAGGFLIEQCRLGFVAARAVLMQSFNGEGRSFPTAEQRDWDVPVSFWSDLIVDRASIQNWNMAEFGTYGTTSMPRVWVSIRSVHFSRASLDAMLPANSRETTLAMTNLGAPNYKAIGQEDKPAMSNAELERWWVAKANIRDHLTHDEIGALLKDKFPNSSVTRGRIRQLTGERKTGPKSVSPKSAAK